MLEILDYQISGIRLAMKGMRLPYKGDHLSDSRDHGIGPKDLTLALKLSKAGTDHAKFMRMIHVQVMVKAPLYWWKEADTYKVGTVANSESTMHTITKKPFTTDDFSCDCGYPLSIAGRTVNELNCLRNAWKVANEEDKPRIWRAMIQILPSSYNQTRVWDLNYQVLKNIYHARKNHKLTEWRDFCKWVEILPYSELITAANVPEPATE